MRSLYSCLTLLLLASCGDVKSNNILEIEENQTSNPKYGKSLPELLASGDARRIPDLLPTMYYTPKESTIRCKGGYGGSNYNGNEKQKLLTTKGTYIATVCKRFASALLMEGSAILSDRGDGEIAVNYSRKVNGQARYHVLDRCKFGEGVRNNLCLLPYHTIAADNKVHKVNEIIHIPAAEGIRLPDGSIHEGYFIVRDTGGAFKGIGPKRVDLFVGTDPDHDNAFQKAGFHHKRALDAFKITGESAERIKERLKDKFGDLY